MSEAIFHTLSKTDRQYFRDEYLCRLNKIIAHIEHNHDSIHDHDKLSRLCYFSPRHFHRIFKAFIGLTLHEFTEVIRIEKAAQLLMANPSSRISEISQECGFEKTNQFTKQFKQHFTDSPSEWRKKTRSHERKQKKGHTDEIEPNRKTLHNPKLQLPVYASMPELNIWQKTTLSPLNHFFIENFQSLEAISISHIGAYKDIEASHQKIEDLCRFLKEANHSSDGNHEFVKLFHHNPDQTLPNEQKTSICVTSSEFEEPGTMFEEISLPGGLYAVGNFELKQNDYDKAWNTLCGIWLPESGYQPDERPCFELYPQNPCLNGTHPHQVKLCIPVKPL